MTCSILVVDDDVDIRELLTEVLQDHGFRVQGAGNGREALAYLATAATQPSLIFLDLMMPIMNGWELVAALRSDPKHAAVPVVVVSADRDVTEHAARLKAQSYLQKPVELAALLRLAKQYCSAE